MKINLNLLECTAMLGKGTLFKPVAWESVSLNETAVEEHQRQNNVRDVRNHVDKGWIRSYPKFRSDSSNFNPYRILSYYFSISRNGHSNDCAQQSIWR